MYGSVNMSEWVGASTYSEHPSEHYCQFIFECTTTNFGVVFGSIYGSANSHGIKQSMANSHGIKHSLKIVSTPANSNTMHTRKHYCQFKQTKMHTSEHYRQFKHNALLPSVQAKIIASNKFIFEFECTTANLGAHEFVH